MSSSGEMKMSLKLMICGGAQRTIPRAAAVDEEGLYILMAQMFEKFQFTIRPLRQYRGAERFHDLLDRNRLSGKLILSRAVESAAVRMCDDGDGDGGGSATYQTRPKAPIPTGWRSVYLSGAT